MSFIKTLSESQLIPSVQSLERYSAKEIAEMTYLYLCAMRILFAEEDSQSFARDYARKTIIWHGFDSWRSNATDLYALLYGLNHLGHQDDHEFGGYPINQQHIYQWLHDGSHGVASEALTKRLFMRLDYDLRIRHESMKSIRRLVMDWPHISEENKRLTMTRLLQFMRARMPRGEIVSYMHKLADHRDLAMSNVFNMETGEIDGAPKKKSVLDFIKRLTKRG